MLVVKTSAKKYCPECFVLSRRESSKRYYESYVADGRIIEYRKKMAEQQRIRLLDDEYRLISRARTRARSKGVKCTLKRGDLNIPDVCPVFSTPFVAKTEYAMSIDAIDPSKDYTKDNVQIISMKANAMKNSATKEELLEFAKWVFKVAREPDVPEIEI